MGRTWVQSISPQQPGAVLEPVPSKTICLPFLGDRRSGTPGTGAFQAGPRSPHGLGGDDARRCQHPWVTSHPCCTLCFASKVAPAQPAATRGWGADGEAQGLGTRVAQGQAAVPGGSPLSQGTAPGCTAMRVPWCKEPGWVLWENPPGPASRAAEQAARRVQPEGKSSRPGIEGWREAQGRQLPAPLHPALPQAARTLLHPRSSCTSASVAGETGLLFAYPVPLQPAPLPSLQTEHPAPLPPGAGPAPADSTSAEHRAATRHAMPRHPRPPALPSAQARQPRPRAAAMLREPITWPQSRLPRRRYPALPLGLTGRARGAEGCRVIY